jgi:hypothetical protein
MITQRRKDAKVFFAALRLCVKCVLKFPPPPAEYRSVKVPTAAVRLRETQNADGGWGYFPGKQSWLEPTFYASIALAGEPAADRAWTLLKSWQAPDGGWRPSAEVQVPSWSTSLCVRLAQSRGEFGEPFQKGVAWLLSSAGNEAPLWWRLLLKTKLVGESDRDLNYIGWPWKPNCASWVEPTAHAIIALKQAAHGFAKVSSTKLWDRVRTGEAHLMDVRCTDAGWNVGNRAARAQDLVAYPETTAIALLGLQGHKDLDKSLDLAARMARDTISPLARAWLTIALKVYGADVPASTVQTTSSPETMIAALNIIAEDQAEFFRTGATT